MLIALLVFLPLLSAPAVYALGRRNESSRDRAVTALTGVEFALSLLLAALAVRSGGMPSFAGGAAVPSLVVPHVLLDGLTFTADGFRAVYAVIAALMWFFTTLFAQEYFRHEREGLSRYWLFTLATLGATEGVMLSADFMTTFVFFELLSLTSFTWVMHERTEEAIRAGYTYLFIAVGGGLVLLMGLMLLYRSCGTLDYAALRELLSAGTVSPRTLLPAGICVLLGFGAKAGMFPLHVWLPMAHPVAPSPASALLSGILTKVGVFGVLMVSLEVLYDDGAFGLTVLILGLVTMALGAALALCSVNLKRTLACSSMSQIGFILTGVGTAVISRAYGSDEAAAVALSGTFLHMVNHSLLKLLLFMAAGVVVMNLHLLHLNDIRGWGRNKPLLKFCFAVGGLGISGVPLLNGYLSKTLLHEGLLHAAHAVSGGMASFLHVSEWVFLVSGGFTFAYMLKLFICVFCERNADPARQAAFDADPRCMDRLSSGTLLSAALLLIVLGQPWVVLRLASFMTGERIHFAAFAWENLQGGLISLSIGAVVYLLLDRTLLRSNGQYADRWPKALDLEQLLYRKTLAGWIPDLLGRIARLLADDAVYAALGRGVVFVGTLLGRALSDSLDALVLFLRRTLVREMKPRDGQDAPHINRLRAFNKATEEAFSPLVESFTFALLMTCVGMIVILGALVALL